MQDEFLHKAGKEVDASGWKRIYNPRGQTPQQENGYDCGVFTIINSYLVARGVPLRRTTYTQSTVTTRSTRRRLAYLLGKAHDEWMGDNGRGVHPRPLADANGHTEWGGAGVAR